MSAVFTLEEEFPGSPVINPSTLPKPVTTVSTLSNGVKVVSLDNGDKVASFGLLLKSGSRDETLKQTGATLLMQRLAFKTTAQRSGLRLLRDLENAGVLVGCSSGREQILYTAECLPGAAALAIDGLAETALSPQLKPWEMKDVQSKIVDHIDLALHKSSLPSQLSEALHAAAFDAASPLGHPVLAPCELSTAEFTEHRIKRLAPSRVTLAGVGISHSDLEKFGEEALGGDGSGATGVAHQASKFVGGEERSHVVGSKIVHVALAVEGPAIGSKDAAAFAVLKALLTARAKGHAGAAAVATAYSDTGLFGVQGSAAGSDAAALVSDLAKLLSGTAAAAPSSEELKGAAAAARIAALTAAIAPTPAAAQLAASVAFGSGGSDSAGAAAALAGAISSVSGEAVKAAAAAALKGPLALAAVGDIAAVPRLAAVQAML